MSDKNLYFINGHGYELPIDFNDRFILPENTYVVLFTSTAVPLLNTKACRAMDFLSLKKNINKISDPVKYKKDLELYLGKIRVYKPGNSMPEIASDLFVNFDYEFSKSGLFKLPNIPLINRKAFPVPENHIVKDKIKFQESTDPLNFRKELRCYKYGIYNYKKQKEQLSEDEYNELYKGSLIKPGLNNCSKIKYSLSSLITIYGEGIYYFGGCRSLPGNNDEEIYKEIKIEIDKAIIFLYKKISHGVFLLNLTKISKKNKKFLDDNRNDIIKYQKLMDRSDYKRIRAGDNGLDDIYNAQYHDIFISLAKFLMTFECLDPKIKEDLRFSIIGLKSIHPFRSLMDESNEQQYGVSSRKNPEKRKGTRTTSDHVYKYGAINPPS